MSGLPEGVAGSPRRALLWGTGIVCASFSGLVLVLHALGIVEAYFAVDLLAAPALVLLLLCGIYARVVQEAVFLNRLLHGVWMGLLATVAYDLVRYPLFASGLLSFNPFQSHPLFGELITGYPSETPTAFWVGWAYHFWNGLGFGVMYTLVAGPARWWYAVIWATCLEVAWLAALPGAVGLQLNGQVVFVSVLGHVVYGVVLGLLAQHLIRE